MPSTTIAARRKQLPKNESERCYDYQTYPDAFLGGVIGGGSSSMSKCLFPGQLYGSVGSGARLGSGMGDFGIGSISSIYSGEEISDMGYNYGNNRTERKEDHRTSNSRVTCKGDDAKRDSHEKSSLKFEARPNSCSLSECKFVSYAKLNKSHRTRQKSESRQDKDLKNFSVRKKPSGTTDFKSCLHVTLTEGSRPGHISLSSTHLIFHYDELTDSTNEADYEELLPPSEKSVSPAHSKKPVKVGRWGKHALERHNLREYDSQSEDEDYSTASSSDQSNQSSSHFHVDSSLIRTIEEQANRQLQLLEYDDHDIASQLSYIEHRAKWYLKKLDSPDSSDSELQSFSDSLYSTIDDYPIVESEKMYFSNYSPKKGFQVPLSCLKEIYPRSYRMKDIAVEVFISAEPTTNQSKKPPFTPLPTTSFVIALPDIKYKSQRNHFVSTLQTLAPSLSMHYWHASLMSRKKSYYKKNPLKKLTNAWRRGLISNYDYLLRINAIAGRSKFDTSHYPIMPWVLSNYTSNAVPDLKDASNFRDLTRPMGAQCPVRLQKFIQKYQTLSSSMILGSSSSDSTISHPIAPFMYGSHYSNSGGVVLYYLVRVRPFAGLHRKLQGESFDVPDRLFYSISKTWDMCSRTSPTEVKELIPEFFSDTKFLQNLNKFSLGKCRNRDCEEIEDVILPPWANNDPEKFIQVMRDALESDFCSNMLPHWIDLIFGYKQKGIHAEKAYNVFYHATYGEFDGSEAVDSDTINFFGHCPDQIFKKPHV